MTTQSQTQPQLGDPKLFTIKELLSPSAPPLHVPDYQRDYSWGSEEYEDFWKDLVNFTERKTQETRAYFLGAIVLVHGDPLEILDGQQRIATATILLSCFAEFFAALSRDDLATEITNDSIVRQSARRRNERTYYLTLNRVDRDFFRKSIQDRTEAKATTQSHRNIQACRNYFRRQLNVMRRELGDDKAEDKAIEVLDALLDEVYVLGVTAFEHGAANEIFQRLNDRGIQLSTVDLIRSLLLEKSHENDHDEILDLWGGILELEGRANVDDLLRHHWITLEGDATKGRLYRLIDSKLANTREDDAPQGSYSPLGFIRKLATTAEIYREIYRAREEDGGYHSVVSHIVELNVKTLIPLMIKIHGFDPSQRDVIAGYALTSFVRNRLIAGLSSTDYEDVVYPIAQAITEKNMDQHIQDLSRYTIDDDEFKSAFANASLNVIKQSRYVLNCLELRLREVKMGHPGELNIGQSTNVHVEHVYPRNPEDGERFPEHDEYVNRIGNMTLLASKPNRQAQNASFSKKRTFFEKSELIHTNELTEYEEWTPLTIEIRQKALADIAVEVWPRPE